MNTSIRNIIALVIVAVTAIRSISRLFGRRGKAALPQTGALESSRPSGAFRRWALPIAVFLGVAGLAGAFIAVSGIMPIKASSGHWPITAWLLNFAMARSISTHSLQIQSPPLEDQALIVKGAGHYEIGCRPCHGSPDLDKQPRIAEWMTPHPPNLSQQVRNWEPNELFYIVKHGVKFTGMPAWPAQTRDDEVWAVVAFLLKLPFMSAPDYQRLARGEGVEGAAPMQDLTGADPPPRPVIDNCGRCHGADGRGRGTGAFPKLAGQRPAYFVGSMQAYAQGRRSSGIMEPIAVALSQEVITDLAEYYAGRGDAKMGANSTPGGASGAGSEPFGGKSAHPAAGSLAVNAPVDEIVSDKKMRIERGREIARRGIPKQRVPACVQCHGPSPFRRNPNYPLLDGQYADYLVLQLTLFKQDARGGTPYAHLMRTVAAGLSPHQMRDVASYYESLAAAHDARQR